jgi:CheY-like chemotaxis protein
VNTQAASVLVVDDDPGVLDVVAFTLRREGFEVDEERDGSAALKRRADAARHRHPRRDAAGMAGTDVCRDFAPRRRADRDAHGA